MKIVAIGDTHGKDTWERIVEKEKDADRIIFIGDYFDSFKISPADQLDNFKEIIALKKRHMDKVVILIGNHDFHYMPESGDDRYSGYNDEWAREFGLNIAAARDLMQISHIERFAKGDYLFTHAGVTESWLNKDAIHAENINKLKLETLKFNHEDTSGYGNDKRQSPIWVRPEALVPDAVQEYVQVVGHTKNKHISYYEGEHPTRLIMTIVRSI